MTNALVIAATKGNGQQAVIPYLNLGKYILDKINTETWPRDS